MVKTNKKNPKTDNQNQPKPNQAQNHPSSVSQCQYIILIGVLKLKILIPKGILKAGLPSLFEKYHLVWVIWCATYSSFLLEINLKLFIWQVEYLEG